MGKDSPAGDLIELDPRVFSRKQLLAAIAGEDERVHPVIAVALLRRKRYAAESKVADLERILDDDAAPLRVRNAAALELGRLGTEAAEAVLASRCGSKRNVLGRAAMAGMGELTRLHGASGDAPAAEAASAAAATSLLTRALATDVSAVLRIDVDRAQAITSRAASTRLRTQLREDLAEDVRLLNLDPESARTVHCVGRTLALVPAGRLEALIESGRIGRDGAVVGALATQETVETGLWSSRYYLVAGPGHDGEVPLRVTTRRGRPVLVGSARLEGNRAVFNLRAVAGAGSVPAVVEGVHEKGRLRLTRALSEPLVSARYFAQPRRPR